MVGVAQIPGVAIKRLSVAVIIGDAIVVYVI